MGNRTLLSVIFRPKSPEDMKVRRKAILNCALDTSTDLSIRMYKIPETTLYRCDIRFTIPADAEAAKTVVEQQAGTIGYELCGLFLNPEEEL